MAISWGQLAVGDTVGKAMNKFHGIKTVLPTTMGLVALALSVVWFLTAGNKKVQELPKVMGRREGCLICHLPMEGFLPAHDPRAIGCASCHMGEPFTMKKASAHKGMILVPGNMAEASRTCGTEKCHPSLSRNIRTSLMATGRGMVSVDRFVFGETDSPNGDGDLSRLGHGPADEHLRKLCASCHLAKRKPEPAPITERSRGGGCTACHLHYSESAKEQLYAYRQTAKLPTPHPKLTIKITGGHCFGCHSRSGRISTNYEGWHETSWRPGQVPHNASTRRILQDGRVFVRRAPDIHFERGMECIDCHTWREAMGDGKTYLHEEGQVEISCEDCHPTQGVKTVPTKDLKGIDAKIIKRRKTLADISNHVLTVKTQKPLLNVYVDGEGKVVVKGKNSGRIYHPKRPLPVCSTGIYGHERLTCGSCHTAWAPHCIRCHTTYDPQGTGIDHLSGKATRGRWIEQRGEALADPPTLGIRLDQGKEVVDTFIPGMVITIDSIGTPDMPQEQRSRIFRLLYAPIGAHTTSAKGRDCASCHSRGLALGYGRGTLGLEEKGKGHWAWCFDPSYPISPEDGLPADAWVGFLQDRKGTVSTRTGARPLAPDEQEKVLRVGACLSCHPANSSEIKRIYKNYPAALRQVTQACRVPGTKPGSKKPVR